MPLIIPPAIVQQAANESQPQAPIAPKPESMKIPMIAAGLGDLGDIISTRYGMAHGADEANPIVPGRNHPWGNTAMLAGQALGTQLLIRALGKNHPKIAKTIGYGTGAFGAFNTVRNIHVAHLWDKYYGK